MDSRISDDSSEDGDDMDYPLQQPAMEVGVLEKFPSENQDHFWAPLELNSPIHIDVVINDFEDDPIMVENDPTVD